MVDSNDWDRLEARFRALQPHDIDGLRAEWYGVDEQWRFVDSPSVSVLRRFNSAAQQAGRLLGASRAHGSLAWLQHLREDDELHPSRSSVTVIREGLRTDSIDLTILRVCEVSADYCERLADQLRSSQQSSSAQSKRQPIKTSRRRSPSGKTVSHRRRIIADFKRQHGLNGEGFALRAKISESAIRGMIRGDRSRYSLATEQRFLRQLAISKDQWNNR